MDEFVFHDNDLAHPDCAVQGRRLRTLSPVQYHYAKAVPASPCAPTPRYLLGDWLGNTLPDGSADVVVAIESTEHLVDLSGCFAQVRRVLRPGGRFVVCAWLARETPKAWEVRHLLEPICREGPWPSSRA